MGKARENIKAMMDAVEAGQTYTIARKGEPVAVVVPYGDWMRMTEALQSLRTHTHVQSPSHHSTGGPMYGESETHNAP